MQNLQSAAREGKMHGCIFLQNSLTFPRPFSSSSPFLLPPFRTFSNSSPFPRKRLNFSPALAHASEGICTLGKCPAYGKPRHKCQRLGHFSNCYRSKGLINAIILLVKKSSFETIWKLSMKKLRTISVISVILHRVQNAVLKFTLKPYIKIKYIQCEQCNFVTSLKSSLKMHVKAVHLKIKDLKCDRCNYTSSQKSH